MARDGHSHWCLSSAGKLHSNLHPDHAVIRPAVGTPHNLHIRTETTLISSHDCIVNHMHLFGGWMFPCCEMVLFFLKPRVHYAKLIGGTQRQEPLASLIAVAYSMSPSDSITLTLAAAHSGVEITQKQQHVFLWDSVQCVLEVVRKPSCNCRWCLSCGSIC